jgi:hypothetical protein
VAFIDTDDLWQAFSRALRERGDGQLAKCFIDADADERRVYERAAQLLSDHVLDSDEIDLQLSRARQRAYDEGYTAGEERTFDALLEEEKVAISRAKSTLEALATRCETLRAEMARLEQELSSLGTRALDHAKQSLERLEAEVA